MVPKPHDVARVLAVAAGYVERGWTRNSMARDAAGERVNATDPTACARCALGALTAAANGLGWRGYDLADLRQECSAALGLPCVVTAWNDSPDRTAVEVAARMREAADKLRTGAQ